MQNHTRSSSAIFPSRHTEKGISFFGLSGSPEENDGVGNFVILVCDLNKNQLLFSHGLANTADYDIKTVHKFGDDCIVFSLQTNRFGVFQPTGGIWQMVHLEQFSSHKKM